MSGMAIPVYSVSKHDPRMLCEGKELSPDFQDHLDLKSKLRLDSRYKYDDALLSMARYLRSYTEANDDMRKAMQRKIKSAFVRTSYDKVVDEDRLYLVERITVDSEVHGKPVNVWTVDSRVFKAVLIQNLIHKWLNQDCLRLIIEHYGLERYYRTVKIGGINDDETVNYVKKFNYYMAEFYKRSEGYNQARLDEYIERSSSLNALVFYPSNNSSHVKFEYSLKVASTLKQTESDIDDFCNNLKYLARRIYEVNYAEDYLKSTTGRGKSHYSVKFRTYDKCLRIYDEYKGKIAEGDSIDDEKYGIKIDKHEGTTDPTPERKRLDRRKDIRKHFNMALELIKQSAQGYLT